MLFFNDESSGSVTPPPTPAISTTLDSIKANLAATTLAWPDMVKRYGKDYTKWPATTAWSKALAEIDSLY